MELEAGAGDGGKTPHAGKRGPRRPREEPGPALTGLSAGQGLPRATGRGTYKMVHIWRDGVAFPRKTWPRSPGLQPPFKDRRRREHSQGLTSGSAAFPAVTALPAPQLEGGRPFAARCLRHPTSPDTPLRGLQGRIFRPALGPEEGGLVYTLPSGVAVAGSGGL